MTHYKPDIVYTGMALGFDQWVAEICIEENIDFIAALPFQLQESKWPPKAQQHYHWLLSKAAECRYVDREMGYILEHIAPDIYHPKKMLMRNQWLVDQLIRSYDTLLALYDKSNRQSGTAPCIRYKDRSSPHSRCHTIDPSRFPND